METRRSLEGYLPEDVVEYALMFTVPGNFAVTKNEFSILNDANGIIHIRKGNSRMATINGSAYKNITELWLDFGNFAKYYNYLEPDAHLVIDTDSYNEITVWRILIEISKHDISNCRLSFSGKSINKYKSLNIQNINVRSLCFLGMTPTALINVSLLKCKSLTWPGGFFGRNYHVLFVYTDKRIPIADLVECFPNLVVVHDSHGDRTISGKITGANLFDLEDRCIY